MVTAEEIEDKVFSIVSDQMGINKAEITRETSFINDLNADSLDIVELVMEFDWDHPGPCIYTVSRRAQGVFLGDVWIPVLEVNTRYRDPFADSRWRLSFDDDERFLVESSNGSLNAEVRAKP